MDGQPLLVDCGLSALIDSSFSIIAGAPMPPTIRWMAPEQINNYGKVTTQADVWAFGMTALVRMLPISNLLNLYGFRNCSPRSPTMTFFIHGALCNTLFKDHIGQRTRLHVVV